MAFVERNSTKFTQEQYHELLDNISDTLKGVDPSLVAHTCLHIAFAMYASGGATREQALDVCGLTADYVGLKRAN